MDCGATELEGDFQEDTFVTHSAQNLETEQVAGETPTPGVPISVCSRGSAVGDVVSVTSRPAILQPLQTSLNLMPTLPCSTSSSSTVNAIVPVNGFVIVGDNIDKNVRPSFQRQNHQTESWHCFHSYAVQT